MYLILKLIGVITLADRLKTTQLMEVFCYRKNITREELKEFYRKFNPELKETTFRWMLYDLKKKEVITALDRGHYCLINCRNEISNNNVHALKNKEYRPIIQQRLEKIYNKVKEQFPFINICIWETSWLNEFMVHQPFKFMIIVEVENGTEESVFYHLKAKYSNVFLKPSQQELERYVYDNRDSIVIKKLVSQAPISQNKKIATPKLEKILVDVFMEKDFYYPYQGQELINIYENAFRYYRISTKSLNRYADRRKCGNGVKGFLKQHQLQLNMDEGVY